MSYGEKIGTIQRTGSPVGDILESYQRVAAGRLLLDVVMTNVLAGVDRHALLQRREGGMEDLYAYPPIDDTDEALRLGTTIVSQLKDAFDRHRVAFGVAIRPVEQDHFLPTQAPTE